MTDTKKSDVELMKMDTRGRVRTPAKRRESLLDEFERSGVSASQFAELAGIKYQTFATWLQKRKRQGNPASKAASTVKWLEAVVEQAQNSGGKDHTVLVLQLPGGASLEIGDAKQIPLAAALVRALSC
jgi:DNA-binding transcriptional regulator YiaG